MNPSPCFKFSTLTGARWLALVALVASASAHASDAPGPSKAAHAAPAAATKMAAAPAAAPADAMESLRQRLAERLSGSGKAGDGLGQSELKVTVRSAPVKAGGPGAPTRVASARATAKSADAHGEIPHWAYNGAGGPQSWASLKPEFSLCANGQRQSPIDIRGGLAVDLEPVRFDYQTSRFAVVDNGHTVQVNLAQGNAIEIGGKRYELQQFHFHRPSEERIDGRQFEMSLHLVHRNDQGELAVVGLLFDKGAPHPVLQQVWNNLPLEKNSESSATNPIELSDLLPADRRYYTYMGSLTTPPCSEGVRWIVMRQPVTLTKEQIDIFARMYPMNARPVQAIAGRRIIQSN